MTANRRKTGTSEPPRPRNRRSAPRQPSAGLVYACTTGDVPPGEGRSVMIAGRRIGVFNTAAGFRAIDNECPHAGGPLSDGLVADDCVTCPLHGRRIDLRDGRVSGHDESVRAYAVVVAGAELWLRLDAPERSGTDG